MMKGFLKGGERVLQIIVLVTVAIVLDFDT